jgi:altronate dehydratase small subunit
MKKKGHIISDGDNIVVATKPIDQGEKILIVSGEDNIEFLVTEKIDFGHKFALRDIPRSDNIVKYGEIIGKASKDIKKGEHVHVHNVESLRGRGDLEKNRSRRT